MNMAVLTERANRATIREASEILGVRVERIRVWCQQGVITATKQWRRVRTPRAVQRRQVWIVDLAEVEGMLTNPPPRRRDIAREMYKEGYSPEGIAHELGIHRRSVMKLLNKTGVFFAEKPVHTISGKDEERLFEFLWHQTLSRKAVARYFGVTVNAVAATAKRLRAQGVVLPNLHGLHLRKESK